MKQEQWRRLPSAPSTSNEPFKAILRQTTERRKLSRESDIASLLAGLRRTARTALTWGDAQIHNNSAIGDPRWETVWWVQTFLIPRLDALEKEARRQGA